MIARFLFLTICSFALVPAAPAQDVEQALKQQYEDKVLTLRHSFKSNSQQYASDGTVLKDGEEGPWTVYKYVAVKKLWLKSHKIELFCSRLAYVYSKESKRLEPNAYGDMRIKIETGVDGSFDSLQSVQLALSKVFSSTRSDVVNSVPEYWRDYLEKEDRHADENQNKAAKPASANLKSDVSVHPDGTKEEKPKIFRVGPGVAAPQPLHTPEPMFSDEARKATIQGVVVLDVVVDEHGDVARVRIAIPTGMGLDDNAVTAVKTWRFKPALRNGEPVAVEMQIEVAFNLYSNKTH